MTSLFSVFGVPLGYIMWACYLVVQSVGASIILFAFLIKVLMFPLAVKQQKATAKSQIFAPKLKEINTKYRNDTQRFQQEMAKLQKQGYNPAGGCLPMVLTMIVMFGVIDVVAKPMNYFERIDADDAAIVREIAIEVEKSRLEPEIDEEVESRLQKMVENDAEITGTDDIPDETKAEIRKTVADSMYKPVDNSYRGYYMQMRVLGVYRSDRAEFAASGKLPAEVLEKLDSISEKMVFAGFDFTKTPNFSWPLVIIPFLSFGFAVGSMIITTRIQKKTSPDAQQQMGQMKYMLYFMPVISLVIAFQFPAGAGFYFAVSGALQMVQSILIYKIWPPEKMVAEMKATLKDSGFREEVVVIEKSDGKKETKKPSEMSASERKEYNRRKLEEARKADLEKYGEVAPLPAEPEPKKIELKKDDAEE